MHNRIEDRLRFIEALFDDGDQVAFGDTDRDAAKPTDPIPYFLNTNANKFCINPVKDWRNGENVTSLNSILIECDDKSLSREDQIQRFEESGLPYTTMMWSGTKSIHCIIRFKDPIWHEDFEMKRQLYKNWHAAIRKVVLKYGITADPSTDKLPQLSRVPGSTRLGTGTLQELITIKERVNQSQVIEWLQKHGEVVEQPVKREPIIYNQGANDGVSNISKFKLARSWTEKKHGVYSTYMPTGAYMWLWHLGLNAYKLDMSFESVASFAQIEWGHQYIGSNGSGKVSEAINKGWTYGYKSRMEKIELK